MIAAFAALITPLPMVATVAHAQNVAAPPGWSDAQSGDKRILSKDGITIEIGPWQSAEGSSIRAWLKSQERRGAPDIRHVSTQRLHAEKAVRGSYSLLRNVQVNGRDQISVLYACPGQDGTVMLMEMRGAVTRQNAADITRGAKFGEEVCAADPNVASASRAGNKLAVAERTPRKPVSTQSLAAANAQIPAGSHPQSASIVLVNKWVGFPAVRVSEAVAMMRFANGYETACTKWNPMTQSPTPESAGRMKRCKVERGASKGKPAKKFRAGETIDISFGRTSGVSRDLGGSNSSTISGGTLRMTKSGRIQIGKFNTFSVSAAGSGAGGGNRRGTLSGEYYLNGHTITIKDVRGRIHHGFIAASSNSGSSKIDHVYINGEHYWDRKK
ncbi:hypothetical protein [Qipengyuania sp. DGS5-3]|uniref:hypothetical protein n=1 Tax=Qipengyuania sp. DGS5-3 TaxID=3349632 RepID=UPI0036D2876D